MVHDPRDDLGKGPVEPALGVRRRTGFGSDLREERVRVETALGAGFGDGAAPVAAVVEAVAAEDAGSGGVGDREIGEGRFGLQRGVHVGLRQTDFARGMPSANG